MIPRSQPEADYRQIIRALFANSTRRKRAHGEFLNLLLRELDLPAMPILTGSGRAALYLLFRALEHERVYIPAYNCWAVLEAARLAGKKVEFLDVDYPRLGLHPDELSRIRRQPGIVVATHQFGFPEDVAGIREVLGDSGHVIIEDCAGSMFSRLRGEVLGRKGMAAIYSFETSKLWTLFSGGLVVSSDKEVTRRVREIHSSIGARCQGIVNLVLLLLSQFQTEPMIYGLLLPLYLSFREPTEGGRPPSVRLTREYRGDFSDRQALLGILLGGKIKNVAEHRRQLYAFYERALEDIPKVGRVEILPGSSVVPIRFPILVPEDRKIDFYQRMRRDGVDLGFSYSYVLGDPDKYPGAMRFARESLNLPIHSGVSLEAAQILMGSLRRHARELRP